MSFTDSLYIQTCNDLISLAPFSLRFTLLYLMQLSMRQSERLSQAFGEFQIQIHGARNAAVGSMQDGRIISSRFKRFRKIAIAASNFIMYVCLSVRPHGTKDFNETWHVCVFSKICR